MSRHGFTLLEVMVAVAIMALSLTAIFSSEAGAIRMAARARKTGVAALLARCKMGEIEEQIAIEGLPALMDSGSDECCEDAEVDGFECEWEIQPIVMPDTMFMDEEGEEGAATGEAPAADAPASPLDDLNGTAPEDLLSGGGDVDGLASMAMSYVYPVLKPAFESQIRRVSVTVSWREGEAPHSFDVTQYVVSDQPVPLAGTTDPNAPGTGTEAAQP
jgi:general secretion pathway protein I